MQVFIVSVTGLDSAITRVERVCSDLEKAKNYIKKEWKNYTVESREDCKPNELIYTTKNNPMPSNDGFYLLITELTVDQ